MNANETQTDTSNVTNLDDHRPNLLHRTRDNYVALPEGAKFGVAAVAGVGIAAGLTKIAVNAGSEKVVGVLNRQVGVGIAKAAKKDAEKGARMAGNSILDLDEVVAEALTGEEHADVSTHVRAHFDSASGAIEKRASEGKPAFFGIIDATNRGDESLKAVMAAAASAQAGQAAGNRALERIAGQLEANAALLEKSIKGTAKADRRVKKLLTELQTPDEPAVETPAPKAEATSEATE